MENSVIEKKSFDFSVRVVNLYRYLTEDKKEFVLSKQILRSGTSVGANVSEGERGQSKADFYSKMSVALKEANETHYWLRLLYATEFITETQFLSLETDIKEIIALLTSICKTTQGNLD
ncbi:MAG: four helix bundle protein [Clostridia bacterium]|nr:four helix bundle protein [Clostridia bacterium]